MGHTLTKKSKVNKLTERMAKVRINKRAPTLQQADGLNVHIHHEGALANLAYRLEKGGFVVLGQLAMKTEFEMENILERDFMLVLEDAIERKRQLKKSAEELEVARLEGREAIPRQVVQALEEIRLALGTYGLRMGMRIEHWENMQMAA
jgi:flagellar hook-basal body complex protein FliE